MFPPACFKNVVKCEKTGSRGDNTVFFFFFSHTPFELSFYYAFPQVMVTDPINNLLGLRNVFQNPKCSIQPVQQLNRKSVDGFVENSSPFTSFHAVNGLERGVTCRNSANLHDSLFCEWASLGRNRPLPSSTPVLCVRSGI